MATRNIVPRATGEGSIGTSAKTWSAVYANDIAVTNGVSASTFTGNLTGTASGNLPLSGGTLTGVVNGVTPLAGDDSTKLATTEYVQEEIRQHGNLPVGYEYFTFNPSIPQGSLPLFGGEYDRATYSDLWAWVQTQTGYLKTEAEWQTLSASNNGNVPFYSSGDGSTTFRVPSLKCWIRGANGTVSEVGSYLEAGLPNITGGFGLRPVDGGRNVTWETNNGAIKVATQTGDSSGCVAGSSSPNAPLMNVTIDASRSSAIYGKSSTVQPESIVGMWVVKAYGTVTNVGSTDVANISAGLTQAETRISAAETRIRTLENHGAGAVVAFAGRTTPQGWLLCDGSAVSRTDYADLYSVIGDTYGAGDGSTTFNLPNLVDKFVEGSATAGTVKSAGLPNITGEMYNQSGHINATDQSAGAFKDTAPSGAVLAGADSGSYGYGRTITFDASRSSAIYGKSTTVQPPALTMRYIIKY